MHVHVAWGLLLLGAPNHAIKPRLSFNMRPSCYVRLPSSLSMRRGIGPQELVHAGRGFVLLAFDPTQLSGENHNSYLFGME